ncbi:hypothetical protein CDD83_2268 [Cordyceps sp. RAO-2017]|nr:hypothetical protein CDD83_2268 [Cordyceps sp. RAO-2017]
MAVTGPVQGAGQAICLQVGAPGWRPGGAAVQTGPVAGRIRRPSSGLEPHHLRRRHWLDPRHSLLLHIQFLFVERSRALARASRRLISGRSCAASRRHLPLCPRGGRSAAKLPMTRAGCAAQPVGRAVAPTRAHFAASRPEFESAPGSEVGPPPRPPPEGDPFAKMSIRLEDCRADDKLSLARTGHRAVGLTLLHHVPRSPLWTREKEAEPGPELRASRARSAALYTATHQRMTPKAEFPRAARMGRHWVPVESCVS